MIQIERSFRRPERIGMLIGSYPPDHQGGAERQCRLLTQSLRSRGFSVVVITIRHSWQGLPATTDNGALVHRLGTIAPITKKFSMMMGSFIQKISSSKKPVSMGDKERSARAVLFWLVLPLVWLSRLEFLLHLLHFLKQSSDSLDLLHVHESGWLAGVGVAIGRLLHIPVICKEATAPALGPIGYDTPFRRTWDRWRRSADAFLAQTSAIRDELVSLGIASERIHLLPNGVLLPPEKASPLSAKQVLYVGNLTQGSTWKAFDVLFDAWIRIAKVRNDASLTVVGSGDSTPWVRILEQNGVRESVEFAGYVKDPSAYYAKAGVFVLPSRVEGMSNALLEAMSWGLPCVVSAIPGNLAVIEHGVNGLVVPVNDAASLAEAILRLLNDPPLRSAIGTEARKKGETDFSIQKVTDRLLGIYQTVLGGKNKKTQESQKECGSL